MILTWPATLPAAAMVFEPNFGVRSGPRTLDGRAQTAQSDAGYLRFGLEVPIAGRQAAVFRGFAALVQGRARAFVLPICDPGRQATAALGAPGRVPHSDGGLHSDGAPYLSGLVRSLLVATLHRRGMSFTATRSPASFVPPVGSFFSLGRRGYLVTGIAEVGAEITVGFWPPARDEVEAGTEVEWTRPVCLVRFSTDSSTDLALDLGVIGRLSLTLEEAV